jgi:hypothetical protein
LNARITLTMTALILAGMAALTPAAQAEEDGAAALKHQLEEVKQQLHELQLRVQRMESELGTAQAPGPAAAPLPEAPSIGGESPRVTAAQPGTVVPPPVRAEAVPSSSPAAIPEAFQWREALKDQWGGIKAGMSSEEVSKRLGAPTREFTLDGKPVWYYSYPGVGNGSVIFSRDGHSVAGWQHPPFGFW